MVDSGQSSGGPPPNMISVRSSVECRLVVDLFIREKPNVILVVNLLGRHGRPTLHKDEG